MKRILEWFRPVERVEFTESELQRGLREEREWARRLADVSARVDEFLAGDSSA